MLKGHITRTKSLSDRDMNRISPKDSKKPSRSPSPPSINNPFVKNKPKRVDSSDDYYYIHGAYEDKNDERKKRHATKPESGYPSRHARERKNASPKFDSDGDEEKRDNENEINQNQHRKPKVFIKLIN